MKIFSMILFVWFLALTIRNFRDADWIWMTIDLILAVYCGTQIVRWDRIDRAKKESESVP